MAEKLVVYASGRAHGKTIKQAEHFAEFARAAFPDKVIIEVKSEETFKLREAVRDAKEKFEYIDSAHGTSWLEKHGGLVEKA